jgi:hypothetical protein
MPNTRTKSTPALDVARLMLQLLADSAEPLTQAEMAAHVGRFYSQLQRPMELLRYAQWITPAGERYSALPSTERGSARGRKAVAYTITPAGRAALEKWEPEAA